MSHAKKVVAIVDDEYTVRRALKRLFRAQGIDSEGFASGAGLLRFLRDARPDCVILGRHIRAAGALDVLLRLAAEDLRIPVIVLTGPDRPRPGRRDGLARVIAFPGKPVPRRRAREKRRLGPRRGSTRRGNQKTS